MKMSESCEARDSCRSSGSRSRLTPPLPKKRRKPVKSSSRSGSRYCRVTHKRIRRGSGEGKQRRKRKYVSPSSSASSTSYDSGSDHVTSKRSFKKKKARSSSRKSDRLYSIFQEHFDDLRSLIEMSLESMASKLFTKNLISSDVMNEIITSQQSAANKALVLLANVSSLVKKDSGKLLVLLEILKQEAAFDDITSKISGERE